MVRYCAVPMCKSGRATERLQNKLAGLRQTSVFKVPKCPNELQIWSRAVGKTLTSNDYICELHFRDEDIKKTDHIVLPHGTAFVSHRERYDLINEAIPICHENENLPEENFSEHHSEEHNHLMDVNLNENNTKTTLTNENYLTSDDSSSSSGELLEENEETLNDSVVTDNVEHPATITAAFSLDSIISILEKYPLPQKWSWLMKPGKGKGIILSYMDRISLKLKFHIEIYENLAITLTNINSNVTIDVNATLSPKNEFWKFLQLMESSFLCSGTGMKEQGYSPDCFGFSVVDEKRKVRLGVYRCTSCHHQRQNIQKRLYKIKRKPNGIILMPNIEEM